MDQVAASQTAPSSRTPHSPTSSTSVTAASLSTATSNIISTLHYPRSETAVSSTTAHSTVSTSQKMPSSTNVKSVQPTYKHLISTISVKKNLQVELSWRRTLLSTVLVSPTWTGTSHDYLVYTVILTQMSPPAVRKIYHLQFNLSH